MFFNSFSFLIFFTTVFLLFWFLSKNNYNKKIILLISSYVFYSFWDSRFLLLLLFSTFLDYYSGFKIYNGINKKFWLILSITINLSILCFFKYFNFFASNFQNLFNYFNCNISIKQLNIILPVGISFYTFHGISYLIDIYNLKTKPTNSFLNYSIFVSFFPLLVAGPIERSTHLLPQFNNKLMFTYINGILGLRQILWGLFKKIVIADRCSIYVDSVFDYNTHNNSTTYLLSIFLFSFQIYCDFSGYTDIALGCAKLLGIDLMTNFKYPYFSKSVSEFWQRWHISLSSWFRDYLYIPLGGSKKGFLILVRNTFIVFLVSGIWHGGNWTFIFWGLLNAFYILPSLFFKNKVNNNYILLKTIKTFLLISLSWIYFRSNNISQALYITKEIFTFTHYDFPIKISSITIILIIFFLFIEWMGRNYTFALENLNYLKFKFLRYIFYVCLVILIILNSSSANKQFIYFQF